MDNRLMINLDRRDGVVVVRPVGRVIRDNQTALREQLEELVREGVQHIALDLEGVDYMDSAGLGCCSYANKLLVEQTSGNSNAGGVAAFSASNSIQETWTMIRLDLVIPMFSTEQATLDWLRNQDGNNQPA